MNHRVVSTVLHLYFAVLSVTSPEAARHLFFSPYFRIYFVFLFFVFICSWSLSFFSVIEQYNVKNTRTLSTLCTAMQYLLCRSFVATGRVSLEEEGSARTRGVLDADW